MNGLDNNYDKMGLKYKIQLQKAQEDNDQLRQANQIAITNMAAALLHVQNLLIMHIIGSLVAKATTSRTKMEDKETMRKEIKDLKRELEEKTRKLAHIDYPDIHILKRLSTTIQATNQKIVVYEIYY